MPISPSLTFIVGMHIATTDHAASSTSRGARSTSCTRFFTSLGHWQSRIRGSRARTKPAGLDDHPRHHQDRAGRPVRRRAPSRSCSASRSWPPYFLIVEEQPHPVLRRGLSAQARLSGDQQRDQRPSRSTSLTGPAGPVPVRGPDSSEPQPHSRAGAATIEQVRGDRSSAPPWPPTAGWPAPASSKRSSSAARRSWPCWRRQPDGVAMVTGMAQGLSPEDAARFASCWPAPSSWPPGSQGARPDRAARPGDPRPDPVRQHAVRARRIPVGTVLVRYFQTRTLYLSRSLFVFALLSMIYLGAIESRFRPRLFRTMGPARRAPAPWHPAD